jgi:Fe-S cluster assembly iron-binding protein IscA
MAQLLHCLAIVLYLTKKAAVEIATLSPGETNERDFIRIGIASGKVSLA